MPKQQGERGREGQPHGQFHSLSSSSSSLPNDLLNKMSTMVHSVKAAQRRSIQHQNHQQQKQQQRRRRRSTLSSTNLSKWMFQQLQQQTEDHEGYSTSFAQLAAAPPPTNMICFRSLNGISSSSTARGDSTHRGSNIYEDDCDYFDYDFDYDFVSSSSTSLLTRTPPGRRSTTATTTTTTKSSGSSLSIDTTTTTTTLPHDIHARIEYVMNSIRMAKQERRYK